MFKNLRMLISDGERHYRFGKVDALDAGHGVMIFLEPAQTKTSRHSDGITYAGQVGSGLPRGVTLSVPYSDIRREIVHLVSIPSDATVKAAPFAGSVAKAFVFPSSVLGSKASFAAEFVANDDLTTVLAAYQAQPGVVSSQTWAPFAAGKSLVLTVMSSSEGTA